VGRIAQCHFCGWSAVNLQAFRTEASGCHPRSRWRRCVYVPLCMRVARISRQLRDPDTDSPVGDVKRSANDHSRFTRARIIRNSRLQSSYLHLCGGAHRARSRGVMRVGRPVPVWTRQASFAIRGGCGVVFVKRIIAAVQLRRAPRPSSPIVDPASNGRLRLLYSG
jgi:hypothetical protein